MAYLQLKHYGVHLHGLDMRDNNILIQDKDVFLKHKVNHIMPFAAKTVENLFACGHERHTCNDDGNCKRFFSLNQS